MLELGGQFRRNLICNMSRYTVRLLKLCEVKLQQKRNDVKSLGDRHHHPSYDCVLPALPYMHYDDVSSHFHLASRCGEGCAA